VREPGRRHERSPSRSEPRQRPATDDSGPYSGPYGHQPERRGADGVSTGADDGPYDRRPFERGPYGDASGDRRGSQPRPYGDASGDRRAYGGGAYRGGRWARDGGAYGSSAYGRGPYGAGSQGRDPGEADRRRRAGADPASSPRRRPDGPRLATPIGQLPRRRPESPAHMSPRHDRRRLVVLVGAALVVAAGAVGAQQFVLGRADEAEQAAPTTLATPVDRPPASAAAAPPVTEPEAPVAASGFTLPGLLTFRGSPTRSYYGEGPVPASPKVLWSYPGSSGGMCAESAVGAETKVWCGTGWTGQPSVFERGGRTWVVFGAYDRMVHFVDYHTGEDILPPFPTGDIIKGSVSVDPDGMPLVYSGSRDNKLHVIAIDRAAPTELWSLDAGAVSPVKWNDDWDGSPLVLGDYLYVGGENSQFHVVKLNRATGAGGMVQVAPELVFNTPGWDDELLASLTTRQNDVSIEGSVAYREGVVYFANSGGLVQGWDVSGLEEGRDPSRVFRFWAGDDVDASVVIDDEGFLYVAVENERGTSRSAEVGQLVKLDPRRTDNPVVWSLKDAGGFWATPALYKDVVIAASDGGTVYAVDRQTGAVRWQFQLPPPTWQSAVVVDDTLIQGDCEGRLHAYDVSDTNVAPPERWSVQLEGCIESTPAVWQGRVFVGTRGGRFYALGDA
jgi:outer membrane protein assembly factor BamB